MGRIGREVARRMQTFGMRVIGFDPLLTHQVADQIGVEKFSLDEIWPIADYITVHTPLIPQTKSIAFYYLVIRISSITQVLFNSSLQLFQRQRPQRRRNLQIDALWRRSDQRQDASGM